MSAKTKRVKSVEKAKINIRWMIRRDMPDVCEIEDQNAGPYGWVEKDFLSWLRQRNCIAVVAEMEQEREKEKDWKVVGFVVYEMFEDHFHILNMGVHPAQHRNGIGTQLIEKLRSKLKDRRKQLTTEVRESNLGAHLFFKSCNFIATSVQRRAYQDTGEDSYTFEYTHPNT